MAADFFNLEQAYGHRTNKDLRRSYYLFTLMQYSGFTQWLSRVGLWALDRNLPFVKFLIYHTMFKQFVGGRNLNETIITIDDLWKHKILTMLDIGIEGSESEEDYIRVVNESELAINFARKRSSVPVITTKVSGLASAELLESKSIGHLTETEEIEWLKVENRMDKICHAALEGGIGVFIDAEESWLQAAIDLLTLKMIRKYNSEKAVVYNTYQLYRHDKLEQLRHDINEAKEYQYILGVKLVRGAYMEKENNRATTHGYPTPIHETKEATDKDFNEAINLCLQNISHVSLCNASHNQKSIDIQMEFMKENNISNNHPHLNFCQLYGMSDYLTYNLASAGYNAAKYVPYGLVEDVFLYLVRRASENSSVQGEVNQELRLLRKEFNRRKNAL